MSWNILARWIERRRKREYDIARELRAHLDLEAEEQRESGKSHDEARYRALREFGNPTIVMEDVRKVWGWTWLEQCWQDIRYGIRGLRRNLGFTTIATLSLAIGIGGNTAVFTLVNAVLLRQLPYAEPDRLVEVSGYYPKGAVGALQQRSRTMEIAAYAPDTQMNLTGQGEAMRLTGGAVSANLFSVLGVAAKQGRTLSVGEDQPGSDRVVVLSDALWRGKFRGDPAIIGRFITIDGVARQVIGVMPSGFAFPSQEVQLWTPLHMDPANSFAFWNTGFMPIVARLREGTNLSQARREIRPLVAQLIPLFPYPMAQTWNADATVIPLQQFLVSDVRDKLVVLQCAVALVLLIACANVASLLLARAAVRQKEMALRSSLGAARGRIIRQLLTESSVLGLIGAVTGLALGYAALTVLKHGLPMNTPGLAETGLQPQVLAFTALLAILTGLAFGLLPAIGASRIELATTLRAAGFRSNSSAALRFRQALTVGEVALAIVLVVGAGLLTKSLWRLAQVNPGFRSQHVLTVRVSPDTTFCQERSHCNALYSQLLQSVQSISGVSEVAATNVLPFSGEVPSFATETEGNPIVPTETLAPLFWAGAVTPRYFNLMHIPLLEGRTFTEADGENSELVVIVSAATAKHFWPGEDPIGKHLRPQWGQQPWRTVVGVVGDVRQYQLAATLPPWIAGTVYMPYPQAVGNDRQLPSAMTLLMSTSMDSQRLAGEVRTLVAELNPNIPVSELRSMEAVVSSSNSQMRAMMWLFVSFAAAAVLLAAIGTYGVISFLTSQRMYEMGVRLALGATRGNLFGLVLKLSLRLALTGLACGILIALLATRVLANLLYGVSATDGLTFLSAAVLLVSVATLAAFVPARRAANVDPMTALRSE